jgi:hypothetical protein
MLTFAAALVSYLLIEAPFLRFRAAIECAASKWRRTRERVLLTTAEP